LNGKRRFNTASIYIPRKNGKSIFGACIGWIMLGYDGEAGAEVYSGATTEKQAWEVFKPMLQMAKREPELAEGCGATVNASSIVIDGDGSVAAPVIGKPGDGASPHCAIVDEYHEHDTSVLRDTMITGMGAREQPLLLVISTAGTNLAGPCRDDWKETEKTLEGIFENPTHFGIIFTIDDGDDWQTEDALRKANPNFDISVSGKFLRQELEKAKRNPRAQATFKTKHLNLWVTSKAGFFNVQAWNNLTNPALDINDFTGKPCILAGDWASKHDLTPLMAIFPQENGKYSVFGRYYLPRTTVDLPENQHFRAWETAGRLTVTDGNVTDVARLVDDAAEWSAKFAVSEMPIDPNRAWGVSAQLQAKGVPVVEYRNTVLTMSEPMKFLDALIRDGKIEHDGDPVLAWAISNVTAQLDKKDNVFPNKERPENKIDPVVSLIMGLGRAMLQPQQSVQPSVFSF
jgi:phage terminase large subunit-like protein